MRSFVALSFVAVASCADPTTSNSDGAIHGESDLAVVEGSCPRTPGAGEICVSGTLHDFLSGQPLRSGDRTVRLVLTSGYCFGNPAPALGACENLPELIVEDGSYTFAAIPAPGSGLVALVAGDPPGTSPQVLEQAGVWTQIEPGKSYTLDAFVVTRKQVDDWSAQAGKDFHANGAYVAFFYDAPVPDATLHMIPNELNPVAGVQVTDTGTLVLSASYFDTLLTMISPSLTATGSVGGGILLGGGGGLTVYSGQGGTCSSPCVWERSPGGSQPGVVAIQAFHNCALSPAAPTCQR